MAVLSTWLILPGLSLTLGLDMRDRGKIFWEWADPDLHFRNFDERMAPSLTSKYGSQRRPRLSCFSGFMPKMVSCCSRRAMWTAKII